MDPHRRSTQFPQASFGSASYVSGTLESDIDPSAWPEQPQPQPQDLIDEYEITANMPKTLHIGSAGPISAPTAPVSHNQPPATRVKEIRVFVQPDPSAVAAQSLSQSHLSQHQHPQQQQLQQQQLQQQQQQQGHMPADILLQQRSITVRNATAANDTSVFNFARPPQQMISGINEYVFLKVIGYGSTGTVWKCFSKTSKILVAAKVIDWNVEHLESHDRINVLREVNTISRLHHPNIVQLIELVEDPIRDFTYIVMELVQGEDLLSYINSYPRVDERDGKKIISQIILALNYCHQNGVIHRDLKPENILIQENGIVKLCDFGLCCSCYTVKAEYQFVCGSPGYIAPEVVFAATYDYSVDYWGLGCLTFSMFTKLIPFGESWLDEYEELVQTQRDPTLRFPDGLSHDAITFVQSLMRTNPKLRLSRKLLLTHPWVAKYVARYEQKAFQSRIVAKGKMFASLGVSEAIRFLGAGAGVS